MPAPINLTQFTSTAGLAILIGIILQGVKMFRPDSETNNDLPKIALYIGIIASIAIGIAVGGIPLAPTNQAFAALLAWILSGVVAALTATGGYEQLKQWGQSKRDPAQSQPTTPS